MRENTERAVDGIRKELKNAQTIEEQRGKALERTAERLGSGDRSGEVLFALRFRACSYARAYSRVEELINKLQEELLEGRQKGAMSK